MKTWVLVLLALMAITATNGLAQKIRKTKKASAIDNKKILIDIEKQLKQLEKLEEQLDSNVNEAEVYGEDNEDDEDAGEEAFDEDAGKELFDEDDEVFLRENEREEEETRTYLEDPCKDKFCGAGRQCIVDEEGKGACECVPDCSKETDTRRRVCSNHNETWESDCQLYRQRCLCAEEKEECMSADYKHLHIDYYGMCQEIPVCLSEELEDFPRRMRDWLFSIMREMADRNALSNHYLEMEKEAENDDEKKWLNSIVWQWCELDGHPKDRAVSRHELFPLRAPLFTLEHCIATFLDGCDTNNDHYITLKEWAICLQLKEEQTENLENLCEDIRDEE